MNLIEIHGPLVPILNYCLSCYTIYMLFILIIYTDITRTGQKAGLILDKPMFFLFQVNIRMFRFIYIEC